MLERSWLASGREPPVRAGLAVRMCHVFERPRESAAYTRARLMRGFSWFLRWN